MSWITFAAVAFIVWWVVIFATLPFGLRTQDESEDVTLGTVSSAPHGSHMLKVVLRTTVITVVIMTAYYVASTRWGIGFESIPRLVPDFAEAR